MDLFKKPEISEMKKPEVENYKDIKPESDITAKNAKDFWKNEFEDLRNTDVSSEEMAEAKLEKTLSDYFKDLKEKSDVKDTVPDEPFEASDLKKISPEENAIMREEFSECKKDLIQQWEEKNDCSWPTYKEDVYITNKSGERIKIREAGSRYDAHHIQPLGMGGKNEVSNITPLRADVHYDHRGVHELGSPYDKLDKMLGGMQ